MEFRISTPQTVAAYIARPKAKKASKSQPAHVSNVKPVAKKQKVLHHSLLSAPAQSESRAITTFRTPEGVSRPFDSPLADGYAPDDSLARYLTAEAHNPLCFPRASSAATRTNFIPESLRFRAPISRERPGPGDETFCTQSIQTNAARPSSPFNGELDAMISSIGNQIPSSPSSIFSIARRPTCHPSDVPADCNTTDNSSQTIVPLVSPCYTGIDYLDTRSNQMYTVNSGYDMNDDTIFMTNDHSSFSFRDWILRDDIPVVNPSQVPAVHPPHNKGGRPRTKMPDPPRAFKGPARFQKNRPVKARVNVDVWGNILLFCPLDFLLKARTISSTFQSLLKDDSPIWKRVRINQFDPDMPDPPLGLSEPQYADLLTGTGCQTRGCKSTKTRKTYWVFRKRLCVDCLHNATIKPKLYRRVIKELEESDVPAHFAIARHYRNMEVFLPALKFDRWDVYQWLGEYDPSPSWAHRYGSGQYAAFSLAAYAKFSSELAAYIGTQFDVRNVRFFSSDKPLLPGKPCPAPDALDAWFDAKCAANVALLTELQAVEDWHESHKRNLQKRGKDLRKERAKFYEAQAQLAGLDTSALATFDAYNAAVAISKAPTMQSWRILLPKLVAELETRERLREKEAAERRERERESERELQVAIREIKEEIQW